MGEEEGVGWGAGRWALGEGEGGADGSWEEEEGGREGSLLMRLEIRSGCAAMSGAPTPPDRALGLRRPRLILDCKAGHMGREA
jgi:hypothetical protein